MVVMLKKSGSKKLYFIYLFLLLMVFFTVFLNILTNHVRELNKKPTYMDIIAIIKSATNTYCMNNKELTNKLFYTNHFIDIEYKVLRESNIIVDDLYNPLTSNKIKDNEKIRIKLTKNNLIDVTYPVKKHKEGYDFFANDLLIEYNKNEDDKAWCSNLNNVYKGLFGSTYEGVSTSKMGLVYYSEDTSKSGVYYNGNYFDTNVNLKIKKCDVNPSVSKTYKIIYSYTNPSTKEEETLNRKVTVRKSSYDIIKFDVGFDENKITYKQEKIPITIIETTRAYAKNEKKLFIVKDNADYKIVDEKNIQSDYTITGFTSNVINSKLKCIISKNSLNSDKTKPKERTITYQVTEK